MKAKEKIMKRHEEIEERRKKVTKDKGMSQTMCNTMTERLRFEAFNN